jgi:hypothetical protein
MTADFSADVAADAAIMEACGSIAEVAAFRSEVERGEVAAGRAKGSVRLIARLNACIAEDGRRSADCHTLSGTWLAAACHRRSARIDAAA